MNFRSALPPVLLALSLSCSAQTRTGKLTIDFIDVEGGQSTLFVTPSGQSLLIDTGWADHDNRDADRIVAAAHKAGLSRIDFVLITHFHDDHVGGVPQLVAKIPVGTFIDHGQNRELTPQVSANYAAYQKVLAGGSYKHIVAKPGDRLPIPGLDVTVISADGNLISQPLPFAGSENPACMTSAKRPADQTENARSLGVQITFGKLKILDLGDLTWDKEMELMCPANKLGTVDVLVVSHHGWNQSSSPALVQAIHPRVAVMDNGETKGGSIETFKTLAATTSPNGAPTPLWQLHFSDEAGKPLNQPDKFIANPPGPDAGYGLELTASPDGSFSILNLRTHSTQSYPALQPKP
jgi:competence protein ComEC